MRSISRTGSPPPSARWRPLSARAIAAAAAVAALAMVTLGCTSGDDADDGDTSAPTVEEVLADATEAMGEIETAAFTLEQTGADVAIDEAGQLRFLAADGRIARPSSADAVVTVDALGFTTEVGAIAIDGAVWLTNPLTGDWMEAPPELSFDPAAMFDPDDGLAALLAEAAPTAELLASDAPATSAGTGAGAIELPAGPEGDGPWYRVRSDVSAERVGILTGGLLSVETTVEAWIDQATGRLAELRFDLPIGEEVSGWRMTITDYDLDVTISPPESVDPGP